ncbi:MAG: TonB-dependent siderophore receptor [bacterium]
MQLRAILSALSMALIVVAPVKGLAQEVEPPAGKKVSSETEQGATELPEMTVTASPLDDTSYNVPDATTATKTDTPIMETPVSIQVVPQQVLGDQQAYRLEDAVKNVSGIQLTPLSSNQFDGFLYRGFAGSQALLRNGYRFSVGVTKLDLTNVERLEVLKGPAAVLYGQQTEPGGIINVVTKKPLATPYYSLEQEFGSYDFYQTSADATGPITGDGALLYRLTLGYLNTESFRDFGFQERVFLVPSLSWRPSPGNR